MSYANVQGALSQYHQVGVQGGIAEASPHRLIQMLLDGALEKISTAKGHMERKEFADKAKHVSWAISIVGGLRASLNLEAGGEVAQNLDALYDYMDRRLMEANLKNDSSILDEISSLLATIKEGWDAIPEEFRNAKPGATVQAR